ncbi:hypothetical protein ACKI1O_32965 [Streptomyces scabiei]
MRRQPPKLPGAVVRADGVVRRGGEALVLCGDRNRPRVCGGAEGAGRGAGGGAG